MEQGEDDGVLVVQQPSQHHDFGCGARSELEASCGRADLGDCAECVPQSPDFHAQAGAVGVVRAQDGKGALDLGVGKEATRSTEGRSRAKRAGRFAEQLARAVELTEARQRDAAQAERGRVATQCHALERGEDVSRVERARGRDQDCIQGSHFAAAFSGCLRARAESRHACHSPQCRRRSYELGMTTHTLVSQDEWLVARQRLLEKEKEFSLARERLAAERRALPWVELEKSYVFATEAGKKTLAELFAGRSQLVVYHFMFGPDWEAGCHGCSFWADSFDHIGPHLNARDTTFLAISRAPLAKLLAYRARLGWSFEWASSLDNEFNHDLSVSFTPEESATKAPLYNYGKERVSSAEKPGTSVFAHDGERIFHTYSCYARGLDMMNAAYQYLDLVPKGRDEQSLDFSMNWLKRRDEYAR